MSTIKNNIILALDTSTKICSVAVRTEKNLYTRNIDSDGDHLKILLPTIKQTLEDAQLPVEAIGLCVCSGGPGSFFGLRIALSTVKGLHGALGIPFVTLPTLEIYRGAHTPQPNLRIGIIRATKKIFYAAVYCDGKELLTAQEFDLSSLKQLVAKLRNTHPHTEPVITSVDNDLLQHITHEITIKTQHIQSSAAILCKLGKRKYQQSGIEEITINPYYLRSIDAEKMYS